MYEARIYFDYRTDPVIIERMKDTILFNAAKGYCQDHCFIIEKMEWEGNILFVYCY